MPKFAFKRPNPMLKMKIRLMSDSNVGLTSNQIVLRLKMKIGLTSEPNPTSFDVGC